MITIRLRFIICLVSSFLFSFNAISQSDTSNSGTEFWVGYGHHQFMETGSNTQAMVLYLSTGNQPATVTVTIDSSGPTPATWWTRSYSIAANTAIVSDNIPGTAALYSSPFPAGTGSTGIFRGKGIHIQSNVPIVAYAHIYGSASSGATMLMPVQAWGGLYTSVNSNQAYASNAFSWAYVIAKYDNTVIEITPSVKTRSQNTSGLQQGVASTITLMKGQIYQILGANTGSDVNGNGGSNADGYELTGTVIKSVMSPTGYIHPIAVFSGSSRTTNSATCGTGGGDNDMQQHFPRQAWGRKYLTAPTSNMGTSTFMTNTYKIAVSDPTTVVKRNGVALSSLIANGYYKYESSTADYIEADKPVLVAQFMTGGGCIGTGSVGDPEMFYLSPLIQGINDAVFYRTTIEGISINFLTLIIPTSGLASLTIDGTAVFDYTYPHPQLPGYTVVVKRWTAARAQAIVHSDSAFTGITYGLGSVESYGYNLGANLKAVNDMDASVVPSDFTGVLPLSLISFSGIRKETDVLLQWKTANEINFDHFEVERSVNGSNFNVIEQVTARQGVQGIYTMTDINALNRFAANKALYYRLKMVDRDGKFAYSPAVKVKLATKTNVSIYPNPASTFIKVNTVDNYTGSIQVSILNTTGNILLSKTVNAGSEVPINNLAAGTYIVKIVFNDEQYVQKLQVVK